MKIKACATLIIAIFISDFAFSQDTSSNQKLSENETYHIAPANNPNNISNNTSTDSNNHIYRDTRLGSSSPLYDTYKKNDYGAGAVTTNPNKGSGSGGFTPPTTQMNENPADTTFKNSGDTLYNKNDSSSVTTNPNKK